MGTRGIGGVDPSRARGKCIHVFSKNARGCGIVLLVWGTSTDI